MAKIVPIRLASILGATAAVLALAAPAAHAGGVNWSIGINAPLVGAVVSNGAPVAYGYGYAPVPVYVAPPVVLPAYPVAGVGYYGGYYGRYYGGYPGRYYAPVPRGYYAPGAVYVAPRAPWRHGWAPVPADGRHWHR